MTRIKLTPLEFRDHEDFLGSWSGFHGEVQEAFPEDDRPAYTTVQTTIYRLEAKECGSPRPKDQQCPHFPGGDLAYRRTKPLA